MAWRVHCADSGTFNFEDLAVRDGLLSSTGCILVDRGRYMGVEAKKVGYSAGVIAVPVGQEYAGQGDGLRFESGRE